MISEDLVNLCRLCFGIQPQDDIFAERSLYRPAAPGNDSAGIVPFKAGQQKWSSVQRFELFQGGAECDVVSSAPYAFLLDNTAYPNCRGIALAFLILPDDLDRPLRVVREDGGPVFVVAFTDGDFVIFHVRNAVNAFQFLGRDVP